MAEKITPLFSTHEEDPQLRDEIDAFVVSLAERVDQLQDAEAAGDFEQLKNLCRELGETAQLVGYAPLAEVMTLVMRACDEDKPEAAQDALIAVTALSQRIRLGHRGAF